MLFPVVAFLAASAAQANTVAPAASAAPAPAVKEKKICRMEEPVTGSIAPKRTCKTKAEWEASDAQISGRARELQRTLPSASGR